LPASARQEAGRALAFADTRLQAWQKALIEAGWLPPWAPGRSARTVARRGRGPGRSGSGGREALWPTGAMGWCACC